MFRNPVQVTDASVEDATSLLGVWAPLPGREDTSVILQDACASLARIAADPDQRVLVARVDAEVAGAVHLVRAPLSPLHSDMAVYMMHLNVVEKFRRHGVGHALMEATVGWAEEKDTSHVITAASVSSRDANRFMARFGLGQIAMMRGATTVALRAKLPVETPAVAKVDRRSHRSVGQVLAHRRSMRRAEQTRPS